MNEKHTVSPAEVDEWFEEEASESPTTGPTVPLDPAEKYARSQLRVVRETKDYQLDYLRHALQPGRELIDTAPGYQGRLRWTNKKRSLLIESFLLNIAGIGVLVVVGGPQYRVGSHRQFVLLARALAGAGDPVLRFDVRGMGDSIDAPRGFEQVTQDIGAAIEAFASHAPQLRRLRPVGAVRWCLGRPAVLTTRRAICGSPDCASSIHGCDRKPAWGGRR